MCGPSSACGGPWNLEALIGFFPGVRVFRAVLIPTCSDFIEKNSTCSDFLDVRMGFVRMYGGFGAKQDFSLNVIPGKN